MQGNKKNEPKYTILVYESLSGPRNWTEPNFKSQQQITPDLPIYKAEFNDTQLPTPTEILFVKTGAEAINSIMQIYTYLPSLIQDNEIRFTPIQGFNYNGHPEIQLLFLFLGVYARNRGIHITKLNFENLQSVSPKFSPLLNHGDLYKEVKELKFGNCNIKINPQFLKDYQTDLPTSSAPQGQEVKENKPQDNYQNKSQDNYQNKSQDYYQNKYQDNYQNKSQDNYQNKYENKYGNHRNNREEEEIEDDPPDIMHSNQLYSLNQFNNLIIDPKQFPTNQFIIDFLHQSWFDIISISKFYHPGARFSLSVDHSPSSSIMSQYEVYSTNQITDQDCTVNGADDCCKFQFHLFPRGFLARILSMSYCYIGESIYGVVLHGVFLGIGAKIYGFDRSFTIQEFPVEFQILSDHIYVHNQPR